VLGEVVAGRLSRANAKEFVGVVATVPRGRDHRCRGFAQISDAGALERLVDEVIAANPAALADYRAGKSQAAGFLVGQVMKSSHGQANATLVQATLRQRLGAPDVTGEDPR
jgi:Asp-tRNA(Asn)/Glu-tRNA(Gln) amidotransferase B subunit